MESALKKPLSQYIDKQMGGHQLSAISFNSSHFGKLVLLFSDAEIFTIGLFAILRHLAL